MATPPSELPDTIVFKLYIAGDTLKSRTTIANLKEICQNDLQGHCHIEVIDLSKHPETAINNNISALPTLTKELPLPVRTLIGDLASRDRVLVALDIKKPKEEKTSTGKVKNPRVSKKDHETLLEENARLMAENANLRKMLRKNNG
jgi:circadian clock protein KaiB